jgi:hypothetical protein
VLFKILVVTEEILLRNGLVVNFCRDKVVDVTTSLRSVALIDLVQFVVESADSVMVGDIRDPESIAEVVD